MMDWNLIRSFVAVADNGSLVAAANALGQSQPTVGRHVDELESLTGVILFTRGRNGMTLTEAGLSLLDDARSMASEANRFALKAAGRSASIAGPVRITASDVVSTFILPPVLVALKNAEPGIDIELVPSNALANLLARDADIAIRMVRPVQNDVIAVKVNDLAMGAYAHQSYINVFSEPRTLEELFHHRIIGYDRDTLILNAMNALGLKGSRDLFTFRTDDQVAYMELVKAGAGIGFGPSYVAKRSQGLRRVLPDLTIPSLPMWLASHQELKTSLKIRKAMDFLREALAKLPLDD
jgi:DNA-binding transcriptional LysR family regulator